MSEGSVGVYLLHGDALASGFIIVPQYVIVVALRLKRRAL
jgi:hypothetical protein